MDALMICLVASAIAAFGGRWFQLSSAIAAHIGQRDAVMAAVLCIAIAAAAAALLGGQIANEVQGSGLLLFLALALLLAGAAMLWPGRPLKPRLIASARGPVSAFVLLLAAMLGDSAPFIILATAAWTGETGLAMVGGMAGLLAVAGLALNPGLLPIQPRHIRVIRRCAGAVALAIGAIIALAALDLI
jgi:putative Ca2+/H+ antiporter (TMEM165/GDT1 family)